MASASGSGPLDVEVDWKNDMVCKSVNIGGSGMIEKVKNMVPDDDPGLTAAVAEYAEILRESYWAQEGSLDDVLTVAQFAGSALAADEELQKEVAEFVWLVTKARDLERKG